MSGDLPTREAPGRLSPVAPVLDQRGGLILTAPLVIVTWQAWPWSLIIIAFPVLHFVVRVVELRLLRWWLDDEAFIIERGLIVRKRRVIPRARVQAVDLERRVLHRLFGVTELRIEALGGVGAQGRLPALRPDVAERVRDELMGGGRAGSVETSDEAAAPPPPRVRLHGGDVVVAGLTESRLGAGFAVVGIGFGTVWQGAMSGWFGPVEDLVPVLRELPWVTLVVGFGILVFLFAVVLSFVLTILGYWDFTLHRRDSGDGDSVLEVERGLLTKHRDTVPVARIQAVRVEENVFRRVLGLASVKVVVAGRAAGGALAETNVLLPVGPRRDAFELAAEIIGWAGGAGGIADGSAIPTLTPMSEQARARRRMRAAIVTILVAVAMSVASGSSGALTIIAVGVLSALLAAAVAFPLAESAWRGLGWTHTGEHLVVREGVLRRTTTFLPLVRLQSVEITSTPFQRRRGLATFSVPVARATLETDPRALDLDRSVAEALRHRVLDP